MDKCAIRKGVRAAVKMLSVDERRQYDAAICAAIAEHARVECARVVALFASLSDEPDTSSLLQMLSSRCRVLLPRIDGDEMEFFDYSPDAIQKGTFGINEPIGDTPASPSDIDVIVVPGVAFTRDGKRLGRGKGFYDKYMSRAGFVAYKIGICYPVQIVDALPAEQHDVAVDEVVCG